MGHEYSRIIKKKHEKNGASQLRPILQHRRCHRLTAACHRPTAACHRPPHLQHRAGKHDMDQGKLWKIWETSQLYTGKSVNKHSD